MSVKIDGTLHLDCSGVAPPIRGAKLKIPGAGGVQREIEVVEIKVISSSRQLFQHFTHRIWFRFT